MLKSRVITAVVLLALLLAALFALPPAAWSVLIVVMVTQGAVEWSRLSGLSGAKANIYCGVSLLLMLGLLWADGGATEAEHLRIYLAVYAISALLWLVIVPVWLMAGWKIEKPALMALTGWAVLLPTGLAMLDLRAANPWILLFVMCLVWIADISAYFVGRKFGKHKLAPSISPGKTWEGVAGALLGVSIYVVLAWSFNPDFAYHEALPILLLASWWWVGLAVIGDLFESAVKRQAGVKDSGTLLPGHGGLLDRIDALTSTLPLAALALLLQKLA